MTVEELERSLRKIVRLREGLLDQWVTVMRFDDAPISPELEAVRAAIIADAEWAEKCEMWLRRALARRRAGESIDAGLVDLIARYRLPSLH